MPFSIVVVTWESGDYLSGLVESMNIHLEGDAELIVVDNASSDDPRKTAERWRGETTFLQLDENVGFGRASNVGVGAAKYESVVLLNPDTRLLDDTLTRLAREALELQALVAPRMLNRDGTIQPSASGMPVGVWPWINAFVPGRLMPVWMQARTEPWRLEQRTSVAWLTAACLAAPRRVLARLGPFDSSIELYSEDLDLGLRAARAGIQSIFAPDVGCVLHFGDVSARRRFQDGGWLLAATNRRRVISQFFGPSAERAAWWAERTKLGLRVNTKRVMRLPRERDVAALEAWLAARGKIRSNLASSGGKTG